MEEAQERWVSVSQAVTESGAPERTIYRWIKARRLPTRSSGGAATVELGAVRALAASRRGPRGAVTAGRIVGGGGVNGNGGGSDPETDGLILARLDEGARPLDIVRDFKAAPQRIRALAEELAKLRALERGVPVADQIAAVQAVQDQHAAKINALMEALGEVGAMLENFKRRMAALPFPSSRAEHICGGCGAAGFYAVPLRCTCCGREQFVGFHPPRPT